MSGSSSTAVSYSANTNPSWFDGTNYTVWKKRMRIYLRGLDEELWAVVRKGPVPMEDEDEEDWKEEQKISSHLDSRAMHILFSALCPEERSQVAQCESAKEIWESLQTTHEGTSEVKESRIDVMLNEYESFGMSS
ncbi:unnamed protein product [Linum trigynum]|uniref:DUF4219 domain-containing protein n=1 Tax=Linum trigynum TaxID=586398 RepID=A0AAV2EE86_9ROSI